MLNTGRAAAAFALALVLCAAGGRAWAAADGAVLPAASASAPAPHSFWLRYGEKLTLPDRALTVQFMRVKDSRCPKDVTCIWAGHAAVTLKVAAPRAAATSIVIGTAAPAGMNLPFEASVGPYRFSLLGLEPDNSQAAPVASKQYRARIQVSRQ